MTEYFSVVSASAARMKKKGIYLDFSIWFCYYQNSLQVQQPLGLFLVLLIAILRCQIVKPSVICTIHTTIIMAFSCNSCQSHQVAENWDAKPIVVLFLFPFLPHNNNVSKSNLEFPFFILDVGSDLVRIIKQRWFEG